MPEGFIARWDPSKGQGLLRVHLHDLAELPFSSADLQLGAKQPRVGMAVHFDLETRAGDAPRALRIRPWDSEGAERSAQTGPTTRRSGTTPGVLLSTDSTQSTDLGPPGRSARSIRSQRLSTRTGPSLATRPAALQPPSQLQPSRQVPLGPVWPGALLIAGYVALLLAGTSVGRWPIWLASLAPLLWLLSSLAYWYDRHGARTRDLRERELGLHLLDLMGGWPGGWLAMRWFHLKVRRPEFRFRFRLTVALHLLGLALLTALSHGRI
jgi:uncharacterized membrane protein YsdA (DUF1294 family)